MAAACSSGAPIPYLIALIIVPNLEPLQRKLHAGAACFVYGSALELLALLLLLFGRGWMRWTLALVSLISIVFWYGWTLY